MNTPFKPLEVLKRKPIAKEPLHVKIKFPQQISEEKVEVIEELEKDEDDIEEKVETKPTMKSKIIDKRKFSSIDRNVILDKLRDKIPYQVAVLTDISTIHKNEPDKTIPLGEPKIPIKINKQVVIREDNNELKMMSLERESPEEDIIEKEVVNIPDKSKIISEDEEEGIEELEDIVKTATEKEVTEEKTVKKPKKTKKDATEKTDEEPIEKPKRGRKPKQVVREEDNINIDLSTATIRNKLVIDRLPKQTEKITFKAPTYYMNNRKLFIQKLNELFQPYKKEIMNNETSISCDKRGANDEFELLTHQKIVRDYLNLYTPYRGLLLYHGLGSGKTCTSIAIAEGMKTDKRIFILTPASLKMNFFSELKKCGDHLYKKNQYWEFVSIEGKTEYVNVLSKALSLSTEYIRKNNGAWLVNIEKEANFTEKNPEEQKQIDNQLNEMIRTKYTDINYNGLNMKGLQNLTGDFTRNPFDNSVILIDEAHNFVSRIVNKINKPKSLAYRLYDYLMSATNAKIVLLTGTPIINYPNEIGILYNILRGYIKTWNININVTTAEKINTDTILSIFDKENFRNYDFVEYSGNKLTITRNPFGFINTKKRGVVKGTEKKQKNPVTDITKIIGGLFSGGKTKKSNQTNTKHNKTKKNRNMVSSYDKVSPVIEYEKYIDNIQDKDESIERAYRIGYNGDYNPHYGGGEVFDKYNGVKVDDMGNISDIDFQNTLVKILEKNGMKITGSVKITQYKSLPDDSETFINTFVNADDGNVVNIDLFQRRILGLTSYFRSAQEQLLPRFITNTDGDVFHIVKCEMTPHQFGVYEEIRRVEADQEKRNKKQQKKAKGNPNDEDLYKISSTYRIFSRSACNFAFPDAIPRPLPDTKEIDENDINAVPLEERQNADVYIDNEDLDENKEDIEKNTETYQKRIEKALEELKFNEKSPREVEYLRLNELGTYSPKFVEIVKNLKDDNNNGLHLVYSQFRTIEGIGILKLILEANGFTEFKIAKNATNNSWEIVENDDDNDKPKFVLYTGTESAEEKEIIRNIYNSSWEFVPSNIVTKLNEKHENNFLGEIIKIFMITSSGAEGINLKNTRFVHIVEPYWHMVRKEQVIGRARRICSHQDLPEELRTVKVFLYIATLSEEQKSSDKNIELRIRDVSRLDRETPVTTDETLFEIASIKDKINKQILKAVKESAVDCSLYAGKNKTEPLVCYGFGKVISNQFGSYPSYEQDRSEKTDLNVRKEVEKLEKITYKKKDYALNKKTNEVYDFDSYENAKITGEEMLLVGRLVKKGQGFVIEFNT
jgi:hypothetical protein